MPITVFGYTSNCSEKIYTCLFVQKPFFRKKHSKLCLNLEFIIYNLEGYINMNQYRIKSLPDFISLREATSKLYVDHKFNDPGIVKFLLTLILTFKV